MGIGVGTHEVQIAKTALAESKEKKTEQIMIQFEDIDGQTITAYLACTEKAWQYTEDKLKTCGWDPMARGYRFEELNQDPSPIQGNAVQIVCREETYNGEKRIKVNFINPPGGGFERMSETEAGSFAERLRKRILSGERKAVDSSDDPPIDEKQPESGGVGY